MEYLNSVIAAIFTADSIDFTRSVFFFSIFYGRNKKKANKRYHKKKYIAICLKNLAIITSEI